MPKSGFDQYSLIFSSNIVSSAMTVSSLSSLHSCELQSTSILKGIAEQKKYSELFVATALLQAAEKFFFDSGNVHLDTLYDRLFASQTKSCTHRKAACLSF